MLRVAGSLTLGEVRGYDQVRMLSREGRPNRPGRHLRPLRADLQDPARPAGHHRRRLPADAHRPAEHLRGPPHPGPADLLRPPRRTAPALPRGDGGPGRRPRLGLERRRTVEQPLHRRRRQEAHGRRVPRHHRDDLAAVPAAVRAHQLSSAGTPSPSSTSPPCAHCASRTSAKTLGEARGAASDTDAPPHARVGSTCALTSGHRRGRRGSRPGPGSGELGRGWIGRS